MKVTIDRDKCIGCGVCTHICPKVFEMDDENVATVNSDVNPGKDADGVMESADSCPVDAIEVEY